MSGADLVAPFDVRLARILRVQDPDAGLAHMMSPWNWARQRAKIRAGRRRRGAFVSNDRLDSWCTPGLWDEMPPLEREGRMTTVVAAWIAGDKPEALRRLRHAESLLLARRRPSGADATHA